MKNIPNCVPHTAGNEIAYLKECINTGWISPVGPFVDRFEKEFADYHNVESATAVSSGTAAIHLGLMALGIKEGDLVLCPTITFIGSVNPIKYLGAKPVFLGVDSNTLNVNVESLNYFLKTETEKRGDKLVHKRDGHRIGALIVVHLYGNPAEMEPIMDLAQHYGLPILEDAAESLGAKYKGELVGTIGDVGCFSFNGNKIITTGGGGMIISRHPKKTRFCKHLSTQSKSDSFEFIHDNIGYNYRLSNLCAAVGTAQMERLDDFIKRKRDHADYYKKLLSDSRIIEIISPESNCFGTYWMTLAQVKNTGNRPGYMLNKLRILSKNGLGVRPIWHPIHTLSLYKDAIYFGDDNFVNLYQSILCLPSSVGLTQDEIDTTVKLVRHNFEQSSR